MLQELLVVAIIAVAIVAVVRFEIMLLRDIAAAREVRYLSKPAWVAICLVVIPVGGVLYLVYGRER